MSASLLSNGEQQFIDGNGVPYAGGSVYFYIPNTTTPKNTWQDPLETVLNTNPVVLDGNGRAVIWGDGQYRQVLYDQFGNEIWDKLTYSYITSGSSVTSFNGRTGAVTLTQSDVNSAIGTNDITNSMLAFMLPSTIKGNNGSSAGAPKDLTVAQITAMLGSTQGNYFSVDTGSLNTMVATLSSPPSAYSAGFFLFVQAANTNTGATTLNVNGLGAIAITYNGSALTSGMLKTGSCYMFIYDGVQFELLSAPSAAYSKGGSVTISLPSSSAAVGTVGSSGWSLDPDGKLSQWAYIQLEDNSGSSHATWTFPKPFSVGPLAFTLTNCAIAAGQGGNAPNSVGVIVSFSSSSVVMDLRQTNVDGTLCVYCVTVYGY